MSNSPAATLAEIQQKIDLLALSRDRAIEKCARLEEELSQVKSDLEHCRNDLHNARVDAEFLTLSHKLADSPEALANARHIVRGLIRKVDAAINLIKNDPADI